MGLGALIGGSTGILLAFILSLIMNGVMYFYSEKIVLSMYKAQPLDERTHGNIYAIVRELSSSMNIPMPKLWIVNDPIANAFATGRNPQNASVVVFSGILNLLDDRELRGVLAHELSHVQNRDVLVATIAATMATAIGYVGDMMQRSAIWGSMSGNQDERRSNPIVLLALGIIMPFAAMLMQLAVSRSREYGADETGAHACHDPMALASALEKLQTKAEQRHVDPRAATHLATASLFIVNPFSGKAISNLFSTHPPLEERIKRLRQMHEKMF